MRENWQTHRKIRRIFLTSKLKISAPARDLDIREAYGFWSFFLKKGQKPYASRVSLFDKSRKLKNRAEADFSLLCWSANFIF